VPVTRTGVGIWVGCKVERFGVKGVPVGISKSLAAVPAVSDLVNNHMAERTPNAKRGNDLKFLAGIFYEVGNASIE
jgi:hypothetical protein